MSAKNEYTNFSLLYSFLKKTLNCTQEAVAGHLAITVGTVKNWCKSGLPTERDSSLREDCSHCEICKDRSLLVYYTYFDDLSKCRIPDTCQLKDTVIAGKLDYPTQRQNFIAYLENENIFIPHEKIDLDHFDKFLEWFFNPNTVLEYRSPLKKGDPYFAQSIYLKNTSSQSDTKERLLMTIERDSVIDFSTFGEHPRILIEATGGQGKSLFLRKIKSNSLAQALDNPAFRHVFYLSLTDLLRIDDKVSKPLPDTNIPIFSRYLIKHNINIKNLHANTVPDSRILLLLDGLNELYSAASFKQIQLILDELAYISNHWQAVSIIITTRDLDQDIRPRFLSSYSICSLSGTPDDKVDALSKERNWTDEILSLAKIPMYFNILSNLNASASPKNKYDLLLALYLGRYKQSSMDLDAFFAYYILAPFIARAIHDGSYNSITLLAAKKIADKLQQMDLHLLILEAQKKSGVELRNIGQKPDIGKAYNILFHTGPIDTEYASENRLSPLLCQQESFKFFHDDIRDFLLAFSAVTALGAIQSSLNEPDFSAVRNIELNLNLKDDPTQLVKEALSLQPPCDLKTHWATYKSILEHSSPLTPQAILFAHTLFLQAEYLRLRYPATEAMHLNLIDSFTSRIASLVEQERLECILPPSEDEAAIIRCKEALSDIISKHCEYYRLEEKFAEGFSIAAVAEKILPNYGAIQNQKGKLLLQMYQLHIKAGMKFPLSDYGIDNYKSLYSQGRSLLSCAAEKDFNLSVNLTGMLLTVPAPFLFNDPSTCPKYDFVKAFHLYRSLIFTKQQKNYTALEIKYSVRQAVGLLLKGYVKFNPDFKKFERGDPGPKSVVKGDRNPRHIDPNTIEMARYLLEFVDGMKDNSLDYYRGIVAWYDNDPETAEAFFIRETDKRLPSIFRHYAFGTALDLDGIYDTIFEKMDDPAPDSVDRCHPIYWYYDAKMLELSFSEGREDFFRQAEERMDEKWKNILKQLTL